MNNKNKKIIARHNSYQLLFQLKNLLILIVIIFVNVILCIDRNDLQSYFATKIHINKTNNYLTNDSILAFHQPFINTKNSLKSTLRKKRQWSNNLTPTSSILGNVYSLSPTYNNGIAYCPLSCIPCNYNQCRVYQIRCLPNVVNCCCTNNTSISKYDLSSYFFFKFKFKKYIFLFIF